VKTTYKKLWKLLIDREMTKSELRERTGISSASLAKLGKGENVSMGVLLKICSTLNCDIGDIVETVKDNNTSETGLNP